MLLCLCDIFLKFISAMQLSIKLCLISFSTAVIVGAYFLFFLKLVKSREHSENGPFFLTLNVIIYFRTQVLN